MKYYLTISLFVFLFFICNSISAQYALSSRYSNNISGIEKPALNTGKSINYSCIFCNSKSFNFPNINPMKTDFKNFLLSDKDKYGFTLKNNFLFLLPPLAWNIAFASQLPMSHFNGEVPLSILIAENIFRGASMLYPMFLPIDRQQAGFKPGLITYSIGMLLYFGSWTYLMAFPNSVFAQSPIMRFAPAYLPMVWLTGMSLMSGSKIQFTFSSIFIGLHITEYIITYHN